MLSPERGASDQRSACDVAAGTANTRAIIPRFVQNGERSFLSAAYCLGDFLGTHFLTASSFCLPFLFLAVIAKADATPHYTNRLAREKSPYLLQHAHNPVDWFPWGNEAFQKSKKENKPILLSIGYSTCHWCHVMETESFEDTETARLMNEHYVSIKVDREERPDIDSIYMSYVTATTGSGGWPMTVFLTPERKPFYGGTYFPPLDRYGIPGFKTLLLSIADSWKNRRGEIAQSAESAVNFLRSPKNSRLTQKELSQETLYAFFERHKSSFDTEWGGFGQAPKFPRSHALSMLLRYWFRSGNGEALAMAEKTLNAMADGGIYDQIGGGFHRYSTDRQWRVPHFEKMLYDQALLTVTYLEAYQVTHQERYARVAREILDYVLREMTAPEGGFFSAQDADSQDPFDSTKKREGAYFVWKKSEIDAIFPEKEAGIVEYFYGIEEKGNALSDPHHEFEGQNVLYRAHPSEETASRFKITADDVGKIILDANQKLLQFRSRRPTPHLDDKVLTDWNGLMISAFSFASRVLDEPRYKKAAENAAKFIDKNLKDKDGRLLHRYRDGEAAISATLNDYAFLAEGYLGLYEATFDERWLKEALALTESMLSLFWDKKEGGFYLTASDAEALIARPKELYDGAVPSGNSVAVRDLFLLDRYTTQSRFREYADKTLKPFAEEIPAEPTSYPETLIALDFALGPSFEIIIAGERDDPSVKSMLKEINLRFIPNKIIMLHEEGPGGKALRALAPFLKDQTTLKGKATAYVCQNYTCSLPVTNVEGLRKLLDKKGKTI